MALIVRTALFFAAAWALCGLSSPITQQRGLRTPSSSRVAQSSVITYINDNFKEEVIKIKEERARDIINSIQSQEISLAKDVYTTNGKVETSFVKFECRNGDTQDNKFSSALEWLSNGAKGLGVNVGKRPLPMVLLHGFYSSCLEFRRIAPLLNENRDVYAPDLLGWGFNDHSSVTSFSPAAKLAHLESFIREVVKSPCVLVGASLGGG